MKSNHTRVDLIRHGESMGNLKTDFIDGRNLPVPLSPAGEEQARVLGLVYPLSSEVLLVSSTAERAKQTARIAFKGHHLEDPDERFVEMSQGLHEGQLRADIHTPEYFAEVESLGWNHRAPEGESLNEVADRMTDGVNDWAERAGGNQLVIVSHITAIKSLTARILGLSQEEAIRGQRIGYTQVTRISHSGRGWGVDFVGLDADVVAAEDRKK